MVRVLYVPLLECLKRQSSYALDIQIVVFWVLTPRGMWGGDQRFRCSSTLKMEAICSSETLVCTSKTSLCHNPENHNLDQAVALKLFWFVAHCETYKNFLAYFVYKIKNTRIWIKISIQMGFFSFLKYCCAYSVATIIRRVLDWQLDLLDHAQLHTIIVYTLHNSQQLTLFSSSEDFGSNSATTAATNSYGVPCHYSLTGAVPLSNTELSPWVAANVRLYSPGADHKENTSPIPLLLEWRHYRNGPQRKRWSLPLLRCMTTAVNKRLTVDCWPTACTSQYTSIIFAAHLATSCGAPFDNHCSSHSSP
jgi:hypothetical protein